jgi:hypothetical protein
VLFALLPALIAPRPQPAPQTGRPGPGADPGSVQKKGGGRCANVTGFRERVRAGGQGTPSLDDRLTHHWRARTLAIGRIGVSECWRTESKNDDVSRTSPSWSTARQRYIRSPAIRTTSSCRCQRLLGRGRRRRSRRAITGPNFEHPAPDRFVGDVEPTLGEEILYVPVAQREAQVQRYSHTACCMDDSRRKAVAAI